MSAAALLRRALERRPVRYLLVGGGLFLIDVGVVWSLVQGLGLHPAYAQVAGRATGALTGFFLHRRVTFRTDEGDYQAGIAQQGAGYIVIGVVTLLVSPFILLGFLGLTGDALLPAKVATEVVIVAGNYLAMRFVFRAKVPE